METKMEDDTLTTVMRAGAELQALRSHMPLARESLAYARKRLDEEHASVESLAEKIRAAEVALTLAVRARADRTEGKT